MFTFKYEDGVLTIYCNDVLTVVQPFDPNTPNQAPWANAEAAEAWAKQEIAIMQGPAQEAVTESQ